MLEDDADGAAELEEELNSLGDIPDGELLAFVKKFYQGRAARPGGAQKPAGGNVRAQQGDRGGGQGRESPPRDARDVRCPNCLEKGHTGRECKKPRKEMNARACFQCGELGHIARACPKQDGKAKALELAAVPGKLLLVVLVATILYLPTA